VFAAAGWWFLCQLEAKDSAQKSLLGRAYVLLGLQFSASFVAQLLRTGGVIFIDRFSAPFWITALGFGVGASGFFLASITIWKNVPMTPNA
jgi:hypothetical protein